VRRRQPAGLVEGAAMPPYLAGFDANDWPLPDLDCWPLDVRSFQRLSWQRARRAWRAERAAPEQPEAVVRTARNRNGS